MKKLIILDEKKSRIMGIEEVLNEFRGFAYKTFMARNKKIVMTEDDKQEIDIVIFKTFKTYNEKHCFTTHLVWNIRHYISDLNKYLNSNKRDSSDYEILDLDYEINTDGSTTNLHELISDNTNVEDECISRELIRFLRRNLNKNEKRLLAINLGEISASKVAEEFNMTRQGVSNMNTRFKKKKMLNLMKEFYKNEFKYQF